MIRILTFVIPYFLANHVPEIIGEVRLIMLFLLLISSDKQIGAGTAAGISFGFTALAVILIAAMVIGWRRHKRKTQEIRELVMVPSDSGG